MGCIALGLVIVSHIRGKIVTLLVLRTDPDVGGGVCCACESDGFVTYRTRHVPERQRRKALREGRHRVKGRHENTNSERCHLRELKIRMISIKLYYIYACPCVRS